jgi:hypothetical protein
MSIFTLVAAVVDTGGLPKVQATGSTLNTVLSIVFGITASIALLMIIIGGFRYIVAHGDSNAVAQARNTILYAVIGLVITLAAYSIVTFVVKGIGG